MGIPTKLWSRAASGRGRGLRADRLPLPARALQRGLPAAGRPRGRPRRRAGGLRQGLREARDLRPALPLLQLDLPDRGERGPQHARAPAPERARSLGDLPDVAGASRRRSPPASAATACRRRCCACRAEDREVIVLRHFAELSYAEIGETLGLAEKTVKSRLHEARQRLGRMLEAGELQMTRRARATWRKTADEERALRGARRPARAAGRCRPGFAESVHARPVRERAAGAEHQLSGPARVLGDKNPEFWSPDRRREPSGGGSMCEQEAVAGNRGRGGDRDRLLRREGLPARRPRVRGHRGGGQEVPVRADRGQGRRAPEPRASSGVLQSDTFRKLVANPETRAILASKDFQKAMAAAEVQAFLALASRDAALGEQALDGAVDAQAVSRADGPARERQRGRGRGRDAALKRRRRRSKAFDAGAPPRRSENALREGARRRARPRRSTAPSARRSRTRGSRGWSSDAAHDASFAQLLSNRRSSRR